MRITLISDTAGIRPPELFEYDGLLLDWLIERYGADGADIPLTVFNGSVDEKSVIDGYDKLNRRYSHVYVVHNPLGFGIGVQIIVSVVIAVLAVALMPTPEVPDESRQPKKSPNNALNDQANIARTLQRIPDIFGQVLSYPDLINPTAFEYINNIKFQDEYICIGKGFYLVEEFRNGNTLITDISDSTIDIYEPGQVPTDIPKTNTSPEVNGQELDAPNFANVGMNSSFTVIHDGVNDRATITAPNSGEFTDIAMGTTVELFDTWVLFSPTNLEVSGTYTVFSSGPTELVLSNAAAVNPNWTSITALASLAVFDSGGFTASNIIKLPSASSTVGPFIVPGDDYSEIWIDIIAPQGLATGSALTSPKTVDLNFLVEELDSGGTPTGVFFNYPISVSGTNRQPRFWTFKITATEGVIKGNNYQLSGTRTSDKNVSSYDLERVTWSRLASIEFIDRNDKPGTTRARIKTKATDQVASILEKKFNCLATRKTVTYDGANVIGNIETGVGLQPSRKFADALLHYFIDPALANNNASNLDLDALYSIQSQLDSVFSGEKGEFSFTFDGDNTPALEEMRIICNAARCFLSRKGSFFTVTRDQEQPVSIGLFNRRNKRPYSEAKSIRFNKPDDRDGVLVEYIDRQDNEAKTITLPDQLEAGDPNYGLPNTTNPTKVEAAGIRNYSQAWDRAQYELNKIIHRRVTVESTVGADATTLPLNGRISHVDGTNLARLSSDGEVIGFDGLTVETSEDCVFEAGKTYSVIFRDEIGEPSSPIVVTARTDNKNGFVLSSAYPIVLRGDNEYQRGTLYNFGPDGDDEQNAYLLQRLTPSGDYYYTMELINYTPLYYQADNQTPPGQL